jgi:hypothetical protein
METDREGKERGEKEERMGREVRGMGWEREEG